jgi:putative endonuclease
MSVWRRQCGQRGEGLAVDYLRQQGYGIVKQNYRCRSGEIDIIAWDGSTLVFVEVKTKSQPAFGAPQTMVDRAKQKKIVHVAMTYVQQQALHNTLLRFDVVAVTLRPGSAPEVTHLPAAFTPPDYFFY